MEECIEFTHRKFEPMEVIVSKEENEIFFSHNYLKKTLNVENEDLPLACDSVDSEGTAWIYLAEVFEYIKYAEVDEETRWDFEDWLVDIIKECLKLL